MKTPEMIFESLIEKITRTKAPRSAAAALFTASMILCAYRRYFYFAPARYNKK